jgi:hypothetical protein
MEIMNPGVASSLKYILDCEDPNLESLLYQTFEVELDVFGGSFCHELLPDGKELFVD